MVIVLLTSSILHREAYKEFPGSQKVVLRGQNQSLYLVELYAHVDTISEEECTSYFLSFTVSDNTSTNTLRCDYLV